MIEDRERLDRTFELFEMPEPALERLARRRRRKRQTQRLAAAAVALAIIAVGGAIFARSVTPDKTAPIAPPNGGQGRSVTVDSFSPNLTFVQPNGRGWSDHSTYWGDNDLHVGGTEREPRIWIVRDPEVATHDCSDQHTPIASANELVSWLTSHPGLETSAPIPVEVGGLEGWQLDLRPATAPRGLCADAVPLLAFPAWRYPFHGWRLAPYQLGRIYALQLPRDTGMLAVVITRPTEEFARALADAVPVIETFEFRIDGG